MRATILTTALGCLVLTAACDDSTAPGSELSAEEARAVALAVDDAGTSAVDSNPQGPSFNLVPSRASRDIITHSGSFDVTGACDLGGTARVNGQHTLTINNAPTVQTIDFDLGGTASFAACEFRDRQNVDIELDGTVDFDAERHLNGVAGTASGSQTHRGSVNYVTSNGKSGTCAVDLSATFALSANSASRTVEGSVCGNSVDVTTTWTRS